MAFIAKTTNKRARSSLYWWATAVSVHLKFSRESEREDTLNVYRIVSKRRTFNGFTINFQFSNFKGWKSLTARYTFKVPTNSDMRRVLPIGWNAYGSILALVLIVEPLLALAGSRTTKWCCYVYRAWSILNLTKIAQTSSNYHNFSIKILIWMQKLQKINNFDRHIFSKSMTTKGKMVCSGP